MRPARADTVGALRAEFSEPGPTFEFVTAGTVAEAVDGLTVDTAAVITEYDLPDGTGSTVIVAGPAFSNAEELVEGLVASGTRQGEGALVISTNETCRKLLQSLARTAADLDRSRLGDRLQRPGRRAG